METLVFQLSAPLSAWGDVAVGEYRPTAEYPSHSAIYGLLCAALGIVRDDEKAQLAMQSSYRIAVGVLSQGRLMRDYHTTQVPGRTSLKNRPQATRKDELSIPKFDLNTILSNRDYRQDADSLVAVQVNAQASFSLLQIADAIKQPKFILYLGRKSCPVAAPLFPTIMNVETVYAAFQNYQRLVAERWEQHLTKFDKPPAVATLKKIAWGDEFGLDDLKSIGHQRDLSIRRKDKVITRRGWQFADRAEYIALLPEVETNVL
jgi:CRISPR system Cascade subunit CasD